MSEQCVEKVWRDHRFHSCTRSGSIERDTGWYCKQHDPVARQERLQERAREQNEKWAVESKERHRRAIALRYHQRLVDALRKARAVAASPESFELDEVQNDFAALLAEIDKEAANG